MKFKDAFGLGIRDIKKHKLRFCLNFMSVALVMIFIFALMSFVLTADATVKKDMRQHLTENDYAITISLNGTIDDKGFHRVTWDEARQMQDFMEDYDASVRIRENIWHNDIQINFAQEVLGVGVYYFGEKSNYFDGETPQLISGKNWEEEKEDAKYIWIGKEIFELIRRVDPDFEIGEDLNFTIAGKIDVTLETAGIVEGKSFFVTKRCAIESNIVSVSHINYDLTLKDGKDNVKSLEQLQKSLRQIDKGLVKNQGETERVSCSEIFQLSSFNYFLTPYKLIIASVIIFLTILILGVLKNNAVINVFDNVKTLSLLRCIGLENKKIVGISMVETLLCICLSSILGGTLSLAFKSIISNTANQLVGSQLYDMHTVAYDNAWWLMLCYFAGLVLLSAVYFSLTLTKYLKRKNLLGTLKRE